MYTLETLRDKTLKELKKIGSELNVLPEGDRRCRQYWIDAIAGVNPPLLQLLEVSPGVEVEQAQEPIVPVAENSPGVDVDRAQEAIEISPLLEKNGLRECRNCEDGFITDKVGDIVECPRCDGSMWVEIEESEPAQDAIELAAEAFPGVEVEGTIDYLNCPSCGAVHGLYATEEYFRWEARCIHCDYVKRSVHHPFEYTRPFELPLDRLNYLPIVQAAENSPGVEVDPVQEALPECFECFGDGYVEDTFGFIKCCSQCLPENKREPKVSQSEIALAAKISNSDQNPILTGIALSNRFLARYSPPQSETLHYDTDGYNVDTDGQLSLFAVQVQSPPEPPDPDDFESLDAFREAIARRDWEHPSSFDHCSDLPSSQDNDVSSQDEPLEVSLDSFCEWAPCPLDWYEPTDLLEPSEVSELSAVKSSITSEFFIPTFDRWGDRLDRTDEPPDTGIFTRLPKPKPPKLPPQASQPKSVIRRASRNYPETIPKLFFRVVAGSSTQPARSPPGGDATR